MKRFSLAILLMLLTGSVVAQQLEQQPYWARPRSGAEVLPLTSQQIASDSQKALNGDSDAAMELASDYLYAHGDQAKGKYWYRIAAENGEPSAERNYADLLMQEVSKESRARAIFWYKRAADGGDSFARDALKGLGH
jgi:TPR repeat protein